MNAIDTLDPRDYRRRYELPDQFVWDEAAWPRIDFDGYTSLAFGLLPPAPARVLDVGCGPGFGSSRLLERGYDVVGVDFSERAIGFARILVPGAPFVCADIRELGADSVGPAFDAAVCIEVLEHVPPDDRHRTLEGVYRVLAPGGTFVLTTPTPHMWPNAWDYRRPELDEIRASMVASGFAGVEIRYQHRLTRSFSPLSWRAISNRWYDLPAVRKMLRRLFLARWNQADGYSGAGRYVIRAVKP
jgi:SAM-dependent methyltransferase